MIEQRLNIITLGVSNLKEATRFYQEIFGWQKMLSSNTNITFFKLNGMLLSLFVKEKLAEDANVNHKNSVFKGFTLAYNTRSIVEVDQLFIDFKRKGVCIAKQPKPTTWGGYSGYIKDLDQNLWEIAFNPFLTLDENGNVIETP